MRPAVPLAGAAPASAWYPGRLQTGSGRVAGGLFLASVQGMRSSRPPKRQRPRRALTLPEAAAAVGLSVKTLRRHISRGRLRAERVRGKYGEEYRIKPAALAALGLPVRLPPPRPEGQPRDPALRLVWHEVKALADTLESTRSELAALRAELRRLERTLAVFANRLDSRSSSTPRTR